MREGGLEPPRPFGHQILNLAHEECKQYFSNDLEHIRQPACTPSCTTDHDSVTKLVAADPDLSHLIDAWPTLPESMKAGIVAMVRAAGDVD